MTRKHLTKPYDSLSARNAHYAIIRELTADGLNAWHTFSIVKRRQLAHDIANGAATLEQVLTTIHERRLHEQASSHSTVK
jgi:hypothetical protein